MTAPNGRETWRRVRLVDLCVAHVDCVNRTAPVVEGPTPFKMIRTTNVRNGFIDTENVRYVTEETYERWTRRLVPRRWDVVLTREAPLGDVGLLRSDEPILLGQRLYHFRADPAHLDARFLVYAVLSPDLQSQIKAFGSGSTVEHMRLEDVPQLEFYVPDLAVQRRLADILWAYDELIENELRRVRTLEKMVSSIYREWFVHFRFPGHAGVERVDSPLGAVPESWRLTTVGSLAAYVNRGVSPTYDDNGDSYVINQKCIRRQRLSLRLARTQRKPIPVERVIRMGDVLINSTGVGTLGRVAQLITHVGHCTVDTHVTIVRPADGVDSDWFGCTLLNRQPDFERLGVGATGQTELSRTAITGLELIAPDRELMMRFGALVRPMRTLGNGLLRRVDVLRVTRDLLLPRIMSGQFTLAKAGAFPTGPSDPGDGMA